MWSLFVKFNSCYSIADSNNRIFSVISSITVSFISIIFLNLPFYSSKALFYDISLVLMFENSPSCIYWTFYFNFCNDLLDYLNYLNYLIFFLLLIFVKDRYLKWLKYGDLLYLSMTEEDIDLALHDYFDRECICIGDLLFLFLIDALFTSIFWALDDLMRFYLFALDNCSFFDSLMFKHEIFWIFKFAGFLEILGIYNENSMCCSSIVGSSFWNVIFRCLFWIWGFLYDLVKHTV